MQSPQPCFVESGQDLHQEAQGLQHQTPSDWGFALEGKRILVVDDDENSRLLLQLVLEHFGSVVTAVATVDEAIRELKRDAPSLLLSDIDIPGRDGFDLIRQVRTLRREEGALIPAVALTGHTAEHDRRRVLEAGYTLHLSKPIAPAELLIAVATLTTAAGAFGGGLP